MNRWRPQAVPTELLRRSYRLPECYLPYRTARDLDLPVDCPDLRLVVPLRQCRLDVSTHTGTRRNRVPLAEGPGCRESGPVIVCGFS